MGVWVKVNHNVLKWSDRNAQLGESSSFEGEFQADFNVGGFRIDLEIIRTNCTCIIFTDFQVRKLNGFVKFLLVRADIREKKTRFGGCHLESKR